MSIEKGEMEKMIVASWNTPNLVNSRLPLRNSVTPELFIDQTAATCWCRCYEELARDSGRSLMQH